MIGSAENLTRVLLRIEKLIRIPCKAPQRLAYCSNGDSIGGDMRSVVGQPFDSAVVDVDLSVAREESSDVESVDIWQNYRRRIN